MDQSYKIVGKNETHIHIELTTTISNIGSITERIRGAGWLFFFLEPNALRLGGLSAQIEGREASEFFITEPSEFFYSVPNAKSNLSTIFSVPMKYEYCIVTYAVFYGTEESVVTLGMMKNIFQQRRFQQRRYYYDYIMIRVPQDHR